MYFSSFPIILLLTIRIKIEQLNSKSAQLLSPILQQHKGILAYAD